MTPILVLLLPLQVAAQTTQLPAPKHVVIVIEENRGLAQVIGNHKDAPYLNELAAQGATFTSFFALRHPSQSNYILLFSGDRRGVRGNECLEKQQPFARSLGGELIANGRSFKGYADGLPNAGFTRCKAGKYVRRHAPWISFADIEPQEALSLPFSEFPRDFEKLPTVSMVIPNLDNDMHDGSIEVADTWLKNNLGSYAQWAKSNDSLLIITWDEDNGRCGWIFHTPCDTKPPQNRIPTIFVGAMVKAGVVSDKQYTHLDLLRTLEEMYGLPLLGGSQQGKAINDVWK